MIKRPLVWILGAYLLGTIFAWQYISIGILIGMVGLWLAAIYCLRNRNRKLQHLFTRRLMYSLPLFFILGFMVMRDQLKLPDLYYTFEQKAPCELTGQIKSIVMKPTGLTLYVENNQISLSKGDSYLCENVILYTSEMQDYRIGNKILAVGTLEKFKKASNPGQFNEELYYQIENIDFKLIADRVTIRDRKYLRYSQFLYDKKERLIKVYRSILENREAGTLIAMLLGEKYLLEEDVRQLYQENGISHILAISGLHITLIGMSIFWVLNKCRLPKIASTIITIAFIYSYGVLTNFSVSTNRAVVMTVILLLASLLGKTYDMLSATALSALLILLQNPLQLFSAGFLLSFLAVLGIALLLPELKRLFPAKNILKDNLLISYSATAATAPVILYYFYQFPLYSIITNLIILPFVTVLTLTSLLAGMIGLLHFGIGIFLIGGANYILKLYDVICRWMNQLPYHLITTGRPNPKIIFTSLILLCCFIIITRKYQKRFTILFLIVAQLILFVQPPRTGMQVTMLDVGQGDGIYLESIEGTSFLIDCGSSQVGKVGTYRLIPFLKQEGTGLVDYVILTHMDQDHINGIIELLEKGAIRIGCLLLPKRRNREQAYIELEDLARRRKVTVRYIQTGDCIKEGMLQIYCLHPDLEFEGSSSNSCSTVLSITYGELDLLLTGDLEAEGEKLLIDRLTEDYYHKRYNITPAKDYEILKVAHHGSGYSTSSELLKLLQPEIALISCGLNNRYGHPHPELLKRLEEAGARVYLTYESGAITLFTDGKKLSIKQYRIDGE